MLDYQDQTESSGISETRKMRQISETEFLEDMTITSRHVQTDITKVLVVDNKTKIFCLVVCVLHTAFPSSHTLPKSY